MHSLASCLLVVGIHVQCFGKASPFPLPSFVAYKNISGLLEYALSEFQTMQGWVCVCVGGGGGGGGVGCSAYSK